jgi:hypothetical protein
MARLPLPKAGIAPNGIKYVVKFDRDWQEWQVRAYKKRNGVWKFAEGPTCYCEDRDEAIATFHHLVGYAPGYERANPRPDARFKVAGTNIHEIKRYFDGRIQVVYTNGKSKWFRAKMGAASVRRLFKNPPKSLAIIDKTIIAYGMAVVDGQGTIHWTGGGVTHCGKAGIRTAYRTAAGQCMKHAAKIHDYKAVERIAHALHASGL